MPTRFFCACKNSWFGLKAGISSASIKRLAATSRIIIGLIFLMAVSARACEVNDMTDIMKQQKQVPFQTISQQRYDAARALFGQLFASEAHAESAALQTALSADSLASLGLRARWLPDASQVAGTRNTLLIEEVEAQAQGQGLFLFSLKASNQWVLQAPHQYFDQFTGELAWQLFSEQAIRGLAINTVHRYQTTESDLAHQPASLFAAFAEAYAMQVPEGQLLQIHGFSADKRKSATGRQADIILSNGSLFPAQLLKNSAYCLNTKSALKSFVYGLDIDELGGTKNSSLHALQQSRLPGQTGPMFIHMELSRAARKQLVAAPELRQTLWSCLQP